MSHRYRLDATASVAPGGRIVSYRWTIGGKTVATRPRATITLRARKAPHRVTLTVSDDRGARRRVTTAVAPPRSPTVRITLPTKSLFTGDADSALTKRAQRTITGLRSHIRNAETVTVTGFGGRHAARAVARSLFAGSGPRPRTVRVTSRHDTSDDRVEITIIKRR